MADVAAIAGVSHQTVSRVLNRPEIVRPETRERVERAISELGFRRNAAARALATNRTRLIGILSHSASYFGPARMAAAIDSAARARGYFTTLGVLQSQDLAELYPVVDHLLGLNVDGLIFIASGAEALEEAMVAARSIPVSVIASEADEHTCVASVRIEQEEGARAVTRHLIEGGRRRIAHITGPDDWFSTKSRLRGFRREMAAHGLPGIEVPGNWSGQAGYDATIALLEREGSERVDAIFAANDVSALGVVRALGQFGVRVPDDVAVAGFDDIDGADQFSPPLTTVRQPFAEAGRAALKQLMCLIDTSTVPPLVTVPTTLVVRGSTESGSATGAASQLLEDRSSRLSP